MKRNIVYLIALLFVVSCQNGKELSHVTVVSYNVENLYDTFDDPHSLDNEFLPDSEKNWTGERYQKKLDDLARVITSVNPADLPEIIGLAEIENRKVLDDLVATKAMARGKYAVVHQDSPDRRGIDVALLYRPAEFTLIGFEVIPVDPGFKTRDILHVTGTFKKEEFHFFVNHWPSRIGGLEKSEPARIAAAEVLLAKINAIGAKNPSANVVVMGDMNDTPENKSLKGVLGAGAPDSNSKLVNLMLPLALEGKGTYYYRGNWDMLDNLVVSRGMLDNKGFRVSGNGKIFRQEWMEYTDKKGNLSPNRTYGGPNYYGGVSDHFPVYFEMKR